MTILARKRFSQNFLNNPAIINKIVASIAPLAHDNLVEIGPGRGAITKPILELTDHLNAIEIDRDLIALLKESGNDKLTIHEGDALKFDFSTLFTENKPLRIVGNLPYNISTPLIFHLLDSVHLIKDLHFMLQEEVVDRMNAKPNTKTYGRLSVMIQYFCTVQKLLIVAASNFTPQPKVTSAFIRLIPHATIAAPANNFAVFKEIVTAAFGQRRKTIANSLSQYLTIEQIKSIPLNPKLRAENLNIHEFVKLANLANSQD